MILGPYGIVQIRMGSSRSGWDHLIRMGLYTPYRVSKKNRYYRCFQKDTVLFLSIENENAKPKFA